MDYIDYYRKRDKNKLCVCARCLQAIESHEGAQVVIPLYVDVDDEDDDACRCDWCDDFGFDELYELQ